MFGRATLLIVVAMFTVAGIIAQRINASGRLQAETGVSVHNQTIGKNNAQTGINLTLRRLVADPSYRSGFVTSSFFGGSVDVAVSDSHFYSKPVTKIVAIARTDAGKPFARVDTAIALILQTPHPGSIQAAITTNNQIQTLGSLVVDGRDHTTSGTLIPVKGTLAVWTTDTLYQGGSSDLGGTNPSAVDFAPANPGDPSIIGTRRTYPGGYPTTPDAVLGGAAKGYPEGTLKSIAQSGMGGSQYTTNPSTLTYPLRGVTYVELPSGGIWNPANINGSGILIVHNTAMNALIDNINTGTFVGIMIADDIDHLHGVIIGAVIGLSPTPPGGNCIGNGNGSVLFSRQAISEGLKSYLGGSGSRTGILAWWE